MFDDLMGCCWLITATDVGIVEDLLRQLGNIDKELQYIPRPLVDPGLAYTLKAKTKALTFVIDKTRHLEGFWGSNKWAVVGKLIEDFRKERIPW